MQVNETLLTTRIDTTYLVIKASVATMHIGGTAIETIEFSFAVRHIHKKY
jgi:hypothetical protein